MLTFDGVWHLREVFFSWMNPGFHCTGQMVDSVIISCIIDYVKNIKTSNMVGIVWVSGLLMSILWIEWPMVAVRLWYGQAYFMGNEHGCILLMAF